MHLDAEHLQRLLDGELEPAAGASVRHHLESCVPCRDQVVVAEREIAEVSRLLGLLDHPAPRLGLGGVMHAGSQVFVWGRRAAMVFLGLGLAGVAYAAPGSPVPAWLRSVAAGMRPTPTAPVPAPPASTQETEAGASGIAVSPGERLTVILPTPPGGVLAYVSLADSADLAVRVVSGRASFSSGIDRLAVETSDSSAVFRILVPRTAARIEIRTGTSRLLFKQGPRITALVSPGADGVYLLRIPPRTR